MSSARPTRLSRAALLFLLWLIGLAGAWAMLIEPHYDLLVIRVAAAILHAVEAEPMTGDIRLDGFDAVVTHEGAAAAIADQRLELRTHENNTPLLFALILATPWLTWRQRGRIALVAGFLLAATHLFHFLVCVHWLYAWENVGPYRVTDLSYLNKGFWQSMDNSAQVKKYLLNYTYHFYTHVGRLLAPILLWMVFAARGQGRSRGEPERVVGEGE